METSLAAKFSKDSIRTELSVQLWGVLGLGSCMKSRMTHLLSVTFLLGRKLCDLNAEEMRDGLTMYRLE